MRPWLALTALRESSSSRPITPAQQRARSAAASTWAAVDVPATINVFVSMLSRPGQHGQLPMYATHVCYPCMLPVYACHPPALMCGSRPVSRITAAAAAATYSRVLP